MTQNDFVKMAESLVDQMTAEEMMGQIRFDAEAIPRLGIPAYNYWNEALHGVARAGTATVFPQAIGNAAAFDTELLHRMGEVIATEGRAKFNAQSAHGDRDIYKGLTFWSPNINIFRDPRWGRGHETYGEDPYLTGKLGKAFIQGIQGDGKYLKGAACAKHFAVHSGPENLRHEFDAVVSKKDLWETYLPAFEEAVTEAGVEMVMGAYNRVNGEVCCGSRELLIDILREQWGFTGHVVSDCGALMDFHMHHKVTDSVEETCQKALENGCDMNCGWAFRSLQSAYEKGYVTDEMLRKAAVHVLTTRFKLGLFDASCEYNQISYLENDTAENRALARKAACESMVLLKNDGILPLKKSALKTIGVIGPGADSRFVLFGNYNGTASKYVTYLSGIQDEAEPDIRVLYSEGCDLVKEKEDFLCQPGRYLAEAEAVAEHSDVVILCVGLDGRLEGEEGDQGNPDASGDKAELTLPKAQKILCERVFAAGKPVILLVTGGSSIDIGEEAAKAQAVLYTWYSGQEGGHAAADILFGKVNPSGRLPITIYKKDNTLPDFTDYSMKGRTYRYLTEEPLYPFGYGLSYTTYAYREVCTAVSEDGLHVQIALSNTGTKDGTEVLLAYIRYEGEAFEKPIKSLKYFTRVPLKAGEEKTITFTIPMKDLRSVLEDGSREVIRGTYTLMIGGKETEFVL